jgi:hypothetical protein
MMAGNKGWIDMAWGRSPRIFLLLIGLTILLRSPTLFDSMYLVDEGYSGAIAMEILYGGSMYETAVDTRAPFIYYTYYLIFLFAGPNNLWAVHVCAIGFIIATALIIRQIGYLLADDEAGGWAALGYILFSHAYLPRDTLAVNVEIFTLLPMTASLLCFLLGICRSKSIWLLFSGALCIIATFYRQPSIVQLGVYAFYLLYAWYVLKTLSFKDFMIKSLMTAAGCLISAGIILGYHYMAGNLNAMYTWSWDIAVNYVNSETTVAHVVRRLFLVHGTFILATGLLWYFGINQCLRFWRSFRKNKMKEDGLWLLIVGSFAASYITMFTGWRFPGHYHLMLMPPLALLAGRAFLNFLGHIKHDSSTRKKRIHRFLTAAVVVPVLGFLIMAYIVRERTLAFTPITDYITAKTGPKARIFVWGSAPYIYSFSQRRMATRFTSCSHLVGMYASRPHKDIDESKWIVPGSWDMLASDLKAHPPELIIDMSPVSNNWGPHPIRRYTVLDRLLKNYSHETTVNGVPIYRRNT